MENLSDSHIRTKLNHAFFAAMGYYPDIIQPVQKSGSHRLYFRLKKDEVSLIGTYSPDIDETKAFIRLSEHFSERLLPVPKVIYSEPGSDVYLQTDLGEVTLHDYLEKSQVAENKRFDLYKKALSDLVKIQIEGAKQLDFSVCFPRASFDDVSMMWDLDYFKYVFLKPGNIDFHEDRLLKDFTLLVQRACEAEMKYFLYRDFQSRNIMVGNDEGLYYIDYQGGRRGALQY
ncbi:MAG: phosphotransferase enzyme family protein, partial [Bacteroidetes bacterium HGW-Bacteroidetes-21]